MKVLKNIALSAAALALVASCNKSLETTYSKQESNIEGIVKSLTSSNDDASVDRIDGVVRVTLEHGEGEPLAKNGYVSFYYAGYYFTSTTLSQSNVFATNYETFASSIKWDISDTTRFEIATLSLGEDDIVEGLKTGLEGVRAGDECYVLFSAKHGFGKHKTGTVPSNAALAYHLWIKGVSN